MVIGGGGPEDRSALQLTTRRRRWIRNEQRPEWSRERLQNAAAMLAASFPDAKLRSSTATYNCVGLVFASRRTHVDTDELPLIFEDDGFRRVSEADVQVGDLATYRNRDGSVTHIGIVIERTPQVATARFDFKVLSKWGAHGEYLHGIETVHPLLGTPSGFYTERRKEE